MLKWFDIWGAPSLARRVGKITWPGKIFFDHSDTYITEDSANALSWPIMTVELQEAMRKIARSRGPLLVIPREGRLRY